MEFKKSIYFHSSAVCKCQPFDNNPPTWNNGFVTYSIFEGLKTENADLNNDNTINISELRAYVKIKYPLKKQMAKE